LEFQLRQKQKVDAVTVNEMRIRQEIWLMVDFSNNTSRRDRRKLWHQAQLERFRASSKHAQRREVYKYGIQIV
jgi:hypothetical protein